MTEVFIDCDAVLFDMDGTLVDSREIVERMWLRWAARHHLPAEAILAVAHGRRTYETMLLVAPHLATLQEAAQLDEEEAREAAEHGGETAVRGALELLDALPAARWAVVTSAIRRIALRRVAGVGLPAPPLLLGADDVAAGKPDPEGYVRAAERLGVHPSRCVVVEDTPPGIQAGLAAGAAVIGVLTTHMQLTDCDLVVPDLRSIRAVAGATSPVRLAVRRAR